MHRRPVHPTRVDFDPELLRDSTGPVPAACGGRPPPARLAVHDLGHEGRDVLRGSSGNDVICGRGGGDTIYAGAGHDLVFGGGGDDRLFGQTGRDYLQGGPGNDALAGGGSDDELLGGRGGDVLRARDRVLDLVHGGRGRDRARVDRDDVVRSVERRF